VLQDYNTGLTNAAYKMHKKQYINCTWCYCWCHYYNYFYI